MVHGAVRLLLVLSICSFMALASCDGPPPQAPTPDHTPPRTGIQLPDREPVIRVRLLHVDDETVTIGTKGQRVHLDTPDTYTTFDGPIRIQRSGTHWLVGGAGDVAPWRSPVDVSIKLSSDTPLLLDHHKPPRQYEGVLHCIASTGSDSRSWDLIEYIRLERYLPGVLAAELYAGWTDACYEAQCVAARSFACMRISERTNHTFDVTDGPSTQAYHGVVEDKTAHDAQASTSGMILSWNDRLVPGYFSSCCGGRAATAIDAIGPSPVNDIPPLRGHRDDDYCRDSPLYEWTINRSARTLGRRLAKYGRSHGLTDLGSMSTIQDIQVAEANEHGRPVSLKIIDRNQHHATITTNQFFRASNHGGSIGRPTKELWSGWAMGRTERGRIDLQGHGFGHGVGLCQYGAQGMGKQGHSWREIISWYYPDVILHRAW